MSKFVISAIDEKVNKGKSINFEDALRKVRNYIIDHIDPTFPDKEFMEWCDSDTDKPFKWNKNSFHWS